MSDERLTRLENRVDGLRDFIGAEVTKVHERINVEVQPKVAWWVRPAKVTWYVTVACIVLALVTAGIINWEHIEQSVGWAGEITR